MLGLFGKKSDHPLADIKSAQQVLTEVPKNDAPNTVLELTGWVESIVELADDFRLDHELAVLRMFDDAAQPFLRKLLRDYFAVLPPTKFQENRLWMVLNNYYTHSEQAYRDVLTRYRNSGRGASSIKSELALVSARGIAALASRMKLSAARYDPIDHEQWQHLAAYYTHAENGGYQNDSVALYPGMPGSTSVTQEFAILAVWYGVCAGGLTPVQEHISERLIAYASKWMQVGNQYNGEALFVFDLTQPASPMRVDSDATVHPALRFFEVDAEKQQLSSLLKTLDKGIVPDDIYFCGANYDADLVRGILQRLLASLTLPPPTRRNLRRNINVPMKVVNGFSKMLEQTDMGLNFSQDEGESWEVEDISVTGFRGVLPANRAGGVKIGTLLGSKPENVANWGAGIVRRLSRDDKNNLHVGVEMLSTQIIGVLLTERAATEDGGMQVALYLNRPGDTSGEALLLLRPDTFALSRSMNMEMNGKSYLLLPLALAENGEDYDLARYRLMEQDTEAVIE